MCGKCFDVQAMHCWLVVHHHRDSDWLDYLSQENGSSMKNHLGTIAIVGGIALLAYWIWKHGIPQQATVTAQPAAGASTPATAQALAAPAKSPALENENQIPEVLQPTTTITPAHSGVIGIPSRIPISHAVPVNNGGLRTRYYIQ
jgi:hypothetical protein